MSEQIKTITLTMCDTERMAALEDALEYAINRTDGLNYAIEAVPLLTDPKITAARLLLPSVRWAWVHKR